MKPKLLNLFPIASAAAVILLVPVSTAAAGITFTIAGVITLLALDYGRSFEPLRARARVIPFGDLSRGPQEDHREAA
jgi:hypothetical protein